MANGIEAGGATQYRWDDMAPEQVNELFKRQLVYGEQAMVARIELKKDCLVPLHQHHNEQISMCLSGSMEFTLGGTTTTVRPGDVLVIPGNLPHQALALEDFVGLDIFAPPRQDWIDKTDSYLRK